MKVVIHRFDRFVSLHPALVLSTLQGSRKDRLDPASKNIWASSRREQWYLVVRDADSLRVGYFFVIRRTYSTLIGDSYRLNQSQKRRKPPLTLQPSSMVDPVGPQAPPTLLHLAVTQALHLAARVPPMDYRDNRQRWTESH